MFDAIFFDKDGTLLDTEPIKERALVEALSEIGLSTGKLTEDFSQLTGTSTEFVKKHLMSLYGDLLPLEDIMNRAGAIYADEMKESGVSLKPFAVELLTFCRGRSLKTGLVTSDSKSATDFSLKSSGIYSYFDVIITREDVTQWKPSPVPYLAAATKLGVSPAKCLGVEDSLPGIQAVISAGMQAIRVGEVMEEVSGSVVNEQFRAFTDLLEVKKFLTTTPAKRVKHE